MASYVIRRVLYMIPISLALSFICFMVVELAPGDFITNYQNKIKALLDSDMDTLQKQFAIDYMETLRVQYGLDRPVLERYFLWIGNIVTRGDFGFNLSVGQPVVNLIKERLPWTLVLSITSLVFTFVIGLVVGIYSATHQYSLIDYLASSLAFFGHSVPAFFTALLLMVGVVMLFGGSVGGLFSTKYVAEPWSLAKFLDLLSHLALPLFVSVLHSTAGVLRVARGQLLDIVNMPYVQTARAKGLRERTVIYKHALRNSLHPLVMGLGSALPGLLAGETIISIVLGLPTVGLMFFQALLAQDSYTAGAGLLISAVLLQIGNLLADLALVVIDPTISYN